MAKITWALAVSVLFVLVWYLFVRPFEFEANFKARTFPGDIIQTLRIWDRAFDDSEILDVDSVYSLTQRIGRENRQYIYKWNFRVKNDSITHVNVKITQPGKTVLNKILVPFTDQYIEQDADDIVKEFYNILLTHLKITKVDVIGESTTIPKFCVCRSLQTNQIEKANGMMRDYGRLTSFINSFQLEPDGPPILRVTKWNHTRGKLKFDFCFPIIKPDSLPDRDSITYEVLEEQKALRAIYHGNYITSDRAWYALMRFADSDGYEVNGLPIEYFYSNPNLGVNEKEWRAEIFLPIE